MSKTVKISYVYLKFILLTRTHTHASPENVYHRSGNLFETTMIQMAAYIYRHEFCTIRKHVNNLKIPSSVNSQTTTYTP